MGFFSSLQKRVRSASGWSAWSALGGADYVAESGKCVVYRVQANYAAGDSGIAALSIGTNFVNPLTSGTAAAATCYLYGSDPTAGGDAAVTSPPGGYIASASAEFSASNVGSYILFAFPEISGTPEALYFWFTSSVGTDAYGSNQIYHYATGNWNAALETGTRTPAIYGGLTGDPGGSGGTAGVDRFTIKDCGTRMDMPQSPWTGTMSMGVGEVGRIRFSFDFSVQTEVSVTSSGGAASLTRLYISTDPDIDESTGHPVSTVLQFDADGSLSAARLARGKTYYLFALFDGGINAGSVSFAFTPGAQCWYEGDRAAYTRLAADPAHSVTLGAGRYSVISLTFANSGTARFYTGSTAIERPFFVYGYLSEEYNFDNSDGVCDPCLKMGHGSVETGDPPDYDMEYAVTAGRTYYLFTRSCSADVPVSAAVHIVPPAAPSGYVLVSKPAATDAAADISYDEECTRYTVREQKVSFRYRGTACIRAASPAGGGTAELRAYVSAAHGVDLATGTPTAQVLAQTAGVSTAADVTFFAEEGREYWVYITAEELLYAPSARLGIYIQSPPVRRYAVTETAEYASIAAETEHPASPGESGIVRLELTFKKSGAVLFSSTDAAGTHTRLAGALSRGTDIFPATGDPVSPALASGTGTQTHYSFAALVEAGVTYYFFSRDMWLYAAPAFTIHITPVPGAMHILAGGEEKNALPYIYVSGAWRTAAPMLYSAGRWRTGI